MKQRSKKTVKITDALVRGEKIAYEFEVFPIETEFEAQPAVYVFSRRKLDKMNRGHQKFLCIGQTDSLEGEFSKQKKLFASKFKANVICVRIEEEEKLRLQIEDELKSAYNISCLNNVEKEPVKTERIKKLQTAALKTTSEIKKTTPLTESKKPHSVSQNPATKAQKKKPIEDARQVEISKKNTKTPKITKQKTSPTQNISPSVKAEKNKVLLSKTVGAKRPEMKSNLSLSKQNSTVKVSTPAIKKTRREKVSVTPIKSVNVSKDKKVSTSKVQQSNAQNSKSQKLKVAAPKPEKVTSKKDLKASEAAKLKLVKGAPTTQKKVETGEKVKSPAKSKQNSAVKQSVKKSVEKNKKRAIKATPRKQLAF